MIQIGGEEDSQTRPVHPHPASHPSPAKVRALKGQFTISSSSSKSSFSSEGTCLKGTVYHFLLTQQVILLSSEVTFLKGTVHNFFPTRQVNFSCKGTLILNIP